MMLNSLTGSWCGTLVTTRKILYIINISQGKSAESWTMRIGKKLLKSIVSPNCLNGLKISTVAGDVLIIDPNDNCVVLYKVTTLLL